MKAAPKDASSQASQRADEMEVEPPTKDGLYCKFDERFGS